MLVLGLLGFLLSVLPQSRAVPPLPPGILNAVERSKFERADNINRRIKIYQDASARIQKNIQEALSREDFSVVPETLETWASLLSESLKDIEANIDPKKKKSRALINFEIHLRKSIIALNDRKLRAPFDQQEVFDSCLARAESIRKRFVEILFPR